MCALILTETSQRTLTGVDPCALCLWPVRCGCALWLCSVQADESGAEPESFTNQCSTMYMCHVVDRLSTFSALLLIVVTVNRATPSDCAGGRRAAPASTRLGGSATARTGRRIERAGTSFARDALSLRPYI